MDLRLQKIISQAGVASRRAAEKLIAAMEGMSFDTPKGMMTFRKEDHQAMQSMYHFRVAPGARIGAMADLHLVKEIKPAEMQVPIKNKR